MTLQMPTCRDVATAIAGDELRTARPGRALALRLHLLLCRHCRRYASQLRAIGTAARIMVRRRADDPEALARIRRHLLSRLDDTDPDDGTR